MYQKERLDDIYEIIKANGYVTVKYLMERMHYSSATINRDLNILENQMLVRRSYGGVELSEKKEVPLMFRYHKMKTVKDKLGKAAAELIKDGDIIFIDGSSTTEYMKKYIIEKKDIVVITNNIALVLYLSEYHIHTICLGGNVVEMPCMLGGGLAVENAMKYSADKAFFSAATITAKGEVGTVDFGISDYPLLNRVMLNNSKINCCIVDHEKFGKDFEKMLCTLDDIDYLVSDYAFDEEFCNRFQNTKIITVR